MGSSGYKFCNLGRCYKRSVVLFSSSVTSAYDEGMVSLWYNFFSSLFFSPCLEIYVSPFKKYLCTSICIFINYDPQSFDYYLFYF